MLAGLVVCVDPPWIKPTPGMWQGSFGAMASFAVGLPWSYILARATTNSGSPLAIWWSFMLLNLTLFFLFFRYPEE